MDRLEGRCVAVTGATGLLGGYLTRALLDAGARVRVVVRDEARARALLPVDQLELAVATLEDRAALARAFDGVDAVVSNAALYDTRRYFQWEANYRANKEGTENVLHAAADQGARRVVLISTCAIYRVTPFEPMAEDSPQVSEGDRWTAGGYRVTKALSEKIAWELAAQRGLELTTLRPSIIYGVGDRNFMHWIRPLMKLPLLPVPRVGVPVVYAGDVAQAVVAALARPASVGHAYNVAGSPQLSVYDFVRAWRAAQGRGPVLVPLPIPIRVVFDSTRAQRELGFVNRSFDQGLTDTLSREGW